MSRLWNCEIDVQRRYLGALVTSRCDVRHYVDIRVLQELLQSNVQNKRYLNLLNFRGSMLPNLYVN